MNKKKLEDDFLKLRDEIISIIDLQELIDWYSISTNKDISFLDEMIEVCESKLEKLELSDASFNLVNEIIEKKEQFDAYLIKEAYMIRDRIAKRKTYKDNKNLAKLKCHTKRAFATARLNNDFSIVKEQFKGLISCLQKDIYGLNQYENVMKERIIDLSLSEVDALFSQIKEKTLPLLICRKTINREFVLDNKPISREIVSYLTNLLKLRPEHLEIKNNVDSFMSSFGTTSVKVALNFEERNFIKFVKIACHELGHALYEQNNSPAFDGTFLSGGASTSFHEAIAYFFEHYIGNNKDFQNHVTNKFFNSKVSTIEKERTPIRIESSDVEYPIHILIRYELEKDLINGKLNVDDLKDAWHEKYKTYLGLEVKDDNNGLLQDPHWFISQFGYFPSYVIGRAFASQLHKSLCKNIDLATSIKKEDLTHPVNWLKQNVFSHGMSKSPKDILISSTNEDFNPKYYIDELSSER